ncbi:hypothetical protein TWF730_005498 [Orbilia blumenaviensis]|uniref:Uncharacterized protein n=1 Tax=Orbilia blumenaviensis TaxID=1796055 RepID=A0AAV9VJX6_9PEZI
MNPNPKPSEETSREHRERLAELTRGIARLLEGRETSRVERMRRLINRSRNLGN